MGGVSSVVMDSRQAINGLGLDQCCTERLKSGERHHVRRTTYPFVPERIPNAHSDGGVLAHLDTEVLQLLTICDDYDHNQLQQILLESGCYSGHYKDPVFDEIGEHPSENAVPARYVELEWEKGHSEETALENLEAFNQVGDELVMTPPQHTLRSSATAASAKERTGQPAEFRALNRTVLPQPGSARSNRRRYDCTASGPENPIGNDTS